MISLSITSSVGELQSKIVLARETISDWQPFFEAWGIAWRLSRIEMWDTSGASTGTPWPMYSKATKEHQYAAVKSSIFGARMQPRDVLRWRKGKERLRPSFVDETHPDNVTDIRGNQAAFGSRVRYASNHDEGVGRMPAWAGGYKIPRRPLLALGAGLELRTQELADSFAALGVHAIDSEGKDRSGLSTAEVAAMLRGGR